MRSSSKSRSLNSLPKTIRNSHSTRNTRIRESQIFMKSAVKKIVDSGEQANAPKSVISQNKICRRVASHRIDCGCRQLEVESPAHPYDCAGCSNQFGQLGIDTKSGLPVWLIAQGFVRRFDLPVQGRSPGLYLDPVANGK